ncbi:MAG: FkbM family methyltransferase [Nitrososphaerales archaeon]
MKLLHPTKTPEDLWRAKRLGGREPEVEDVFRPKSGWTVLDVGAHIGYYTVKSSKMVGEGGRVVSIEPYRENYELLLKNLELNSCSNVQVIKKALTNYNGSTKLYFGTDSGHNTLLEESVFATEEWEKVDAVTLDSLLNELGIESIDLAKIDVEGNELNLLEGARGVLTEGRIHRLVVEVHTPRALNNSIHRYLRDLGYEVSVIRRRFPPLHPTRHHIYATRPSDR